MLFIVFFGSFFPTFPFFSHQFYVRHHLVSNARDDEVPEVPGNTPLLLMDKIDSPRMSTVVIIVGIVVVGWVMTV